MGVFVQRNLEISEQPPSIFIFIFFASEKDVLYRRTHESGVQAAATYCISTMALKKQGENEMGWASEREREVEGKKPLIREGLTIFLSPKAARGRRAPAQMKTLVVLRPEAGKRSMLRV